MKEEGLEVDVDRGLKLSVRVSQQEREELRKRAYKARLPVAVFLRESGLAGAPVPAAPPIPDQIPLGLRKLLHVALASVSNCSQLHAHALAFGEPLSLVCPLLETMQGQLRRLGLDVKTGGIDEAAASEILDAGLLAASDQMNMLAEALNEGQTALHSRWKKTLADMRDALRDVQ